MLLNALILIQFTLTADDTKSLNVRTSITIPAKMTTYCLYVYDIKNRRLKRLFKN